MRLTLPALLAGLLCAGPAAAQRFDFVARGDTPYTTPQAPQEPARYDRLIGRINALAPAFSIHVGDTKAGSTSCSDEALRSHAAHFSRFEGAVVYALGDNEWKDCHRASLAALRRLAVAYGRPVLLVHGDGHVLRIDQPLRDNAGRTLETVTRLMVMGAQEVHAVRVTVDPAEPGLFSFTPVRVPENAMPPRM